MQISNDDGLSANYPWLVARKVHDNEGDEMVVTSSTNLLNIPLHVLHEFCVGVEYLNFRATCKLCRLALPVTVFETAYQLNSPWLMVFEIDRGIITFTDPMFGDKYVKKVPPKFRFDKIRILCSRYGWLLLLINDFHVTFFNPFTRDIIDLPQVPCLESFCFSAPPTSPICMVVGFSFSSSRHNNNVYIHFVGREPSWRSFYFDIGIDTYSFGSPTFCGRDVYALFDKGVLKVFSGIHDDNFSCKTVVVNAPRSCTSAWVAEYFLVKCDRHILLVAVKEFEESVEVFKLKDCKWEKMDGLGRHVIFLSGKTCICMDAKIPSMENKIFFPSLCCKSGKIIFYSMETCNYHAFNGVNVEESFSHLFGTTQDVYTHAWIEPSWS